MFLTSWLTTVKNRLAWQRHFERHPRTRRELRKKVWKSRSTADHAERLEERMLLSVDPIVVSASEISTAPELDGVVDVSVTQLKSAQWELVFIDAGIEDYQTLLDGIEDPASGDSLTIRQAYVLDASRDGVDQISEVMADYSNVSAVHILSHGSSGSLQLGSSTLNTALLSQRADQLSDWGTSLTESADILLYGCNVAQGEWGVTFVEDFAEATGADIAASDDLTGNAAFGGDWVFEVTTGQFSSTPTIEFHDLKGVLTTARVPDETSGVLFVDGNPREIFTVEIGREVTFQPGATPSQKFGGIKGIKATIAGTYRILPGAGLLRGIDATGGTLHNTLSYEQFRRPVEVNASSDLFAGKGPRATGVTQRFSADHPSRVYSPKSSVDRKMTSSPEVM